MKKRNILILVVFVILSLTIGAKHEPWEDEAQSWLIARDAGWFEIIWEISRYEGSFPLWFLTLKAFITCGLEYEYLYVISVLISTTGLWVFLEKVEAPSYIKILLPFTYYVFYQYNVVARSYSFFLLACSLWIITYKDRNEKTLRYILSLIFFSFISLHGFVISVSLATVFVIEKIKAKEIRSILKPIALILAAWIVEIIILFPRYDLYMVPPSDNIISRINTIIRTTVLFEGWIQTIYNIFACGLLIFMIFKLAKYKDIFVAIIATIFFMIAVRIASHHWGIIYFLVIFGIICNYQNIKKEFKIIDKLMIILLSLHLIYSIQTGINDFLYNYSGSEEMANYIKNNVQKESEIYGLDYPSVAVQAYFDENIYDNWDKSYNEWRLRNKAFYNYNNITVLDLTQFTQRPDYILLGYVTPYTGRMTKFLELIEETGIYEIEYKAEGKSFFKNSYNEVENYILYRLKE